MQRFMMIKIGRTFMKARYQKMYIRLYKEKVYVKLEIRIQETFVIEKSIYKRKINFSFENHRSLLLLERI